MPAIAAVVARTVVARAVVASTILRCATAATVIARAAAIRFAATAPSIVARTAPAAIIAITRWPCARICAGCTPIIVAAHRRPAFTRATTCPRPTACAWPAASAFATTLTATTSTRVRLTPRRRLITEVSRIARCLRLAVWSLRCSLAGAMALRTVLATAAPTTTALPTTRLVASGTTAFWSVAPALTTPLLSAAATIATAGLVATPFTVTATVIAAAFGLALRAQGQGNPPPRQINIEHAHGEFLANTHHRARIFHEGVTKLRHVNQPVVVHADIDEGAESRNIGDHTLKHHAWLQIFHLGDIFAKLRWIKRLARIAPGLAEFCRNILERKFAESSTSIDILAQVDLVDHLLIANQLGDRHL